MAFVNESIPQPDHSHPLFTSGLRWPDYAPPVKPGNWTIDRARDVFLTVTQMGRVDERSVYFVLVLQDELIPIELEFDFGPKSPDDTREVTWTLRKLDVRSTGRHSRDEILAALKEALEVHGFLYQRSYYSSVNFAF